MYRSVGLAELNNLKIYRFKIMEICGFKDDNSTYFMQSKSKFENISETNPTPFPVQHIVGHYVGLLSRKGVGKTENKGVTAF